ncbi:MAG: GNAT family N-acetyltransferase [Thermonemataceae bacterium]
MRPITQNDFPALRAVIDSNELFPSELLNEMTEHYFNNLHSEEIWITREKNNKPIAVAYCAPEKMTEGTYNLYLIAVHKNFQGQGLGAEIMTYFETLLREKGARILIVETSSLPSFTLTRRFYDNLGYTREATIREFYQKGEDKIVYWKKLNE